MKKILLILTLLCFGAQNSYAQLSAGDIAFIGYNTDGPDGYAFITLAAIPGNEVIYFTDEGLDNPTSWAGTSEDHWKLTAPAGGIPIGTIMTVLDGNPSPSITPATLSGAPVGTTFTWESTTGGGLTNNFNLSAGDQVIAYQASSAEPTNTTTATFIAGVNGDDGNGAAPIPFNSTTKWANVNTGGVGAAGVSRSELPSGLTNGLNCVSLFPAGTFTGTTGTGTSERDNAKYTGTLTGTAASVLASINNYTNWVKDNSNNQAIAPSDYATPNITAGGSCTSPVITNVSVSATDVFIGSSATITVTGTLNDATAWQLYTGTCGGTFLDSSITGVFNVTPGSPSTTYYVRGEGGCHTAAGCNQEVIYANPMPPSGGLAAGAIAFLGYNEDAPDGFSFISLDTIPGNEVIYFTDQGVKNATAWVGGGEDHWKLTAPAGGISCGSIMTVHEGSGSVVLYGAPSGTTFTWEAGGTPNNLNFGGGDQVLAYQATTGGPRSSMSAKFIAGMLTDDGNGAPVCLDGTTKWHQESCATGVAKSVVPPGLTNGVNCVSLFPEGTFTGKTGAGTSERDNAKYTGSLTGTKASVLASINDYSNWSADETTPYAILAANYGAVNFCSGCNDPVLTSVVSSANMVCDGDSVTLTITGTLNDATAWQVYSSSCGGTFVDSTTLGSIKVLPTGSSVTYYVRGEGGCVTAGSCMQTSAITVTTAPSMSGLEQRPGSGYDLTFNGSSHLVTAPYSANLSLTDFTVSAWVKTTQSAAYARVCSKPVGGGQNYSLCVHNGKAHIRFDQGGGHQAESSTSVNDGSWHHISGVFDDAGNTLKIYVDGVLEQTTAVLVSPMTGTEGLVIGSFNSAGGAYFNGEIDEVSVFSTPLTQAELRDGICKKVTSSHPHYCKLEAYYRFDKNTGLTAFDYARGNDGTLQNSPTWTKSGAPLGDAAVSDYATSPSLTLAHASGESVMIDNFSAAVAGVHVYRVDEQPNDLTGTLGVSANDKYFGVFKIGANSITYDVTYNYSGNPYVRADNEQDLRLYKRANDAAITWADVMATLDTAANTLSGMGQNTQFILGSGGAPLPLDLLAWSAEKRGNIVQLEWSTAMEVNTSSFRVERSLDLVSWEVIRSIEAAGYANQIQNYSILDNKPGMGKNYYRLVQVDQDFTQTTSDVLVVQMNGASRVTVSPNPTQSKIIINATQSNELGQIKLYTAHGKEVAAAPLRIAQNEFSITMDLTNLSSGIYMLSVNGVMYRVHKLD